MRSVMIMMMMMTTTMMMNTLLLFFLNFMFLLYSLSLSYFLSNVCVYVVYIYIYTLFLWISAHVMAYFYSNFIDSHPTPIHWLLVVFLFSFMFVASHMRLCVCASSLLRHTRILHHGNLTDVDRSVLTTP